MTEPSFARFRPRDFRAGAILARSLDILSRNFIGFAVIAGLVTLPNYLVEVARGDSFLWTILAAIVNGIMYYVSQGFIAYGAVQDLEGRSVDAAESLKVAMARFFPLMGLAGWVGLAVGLGFLLLIVPGIWFAVMWSVAIPVCVVEGIAPVASMHRSAALTKGFRWTLFGLYLLLFVVLKLGLILIVKVLAIIGGDGVQAFGSWIGKALVAAFQAVVAAVIYHDLCALKEGPDPGRAAAAGWR